MGGSINNGIGGIESIRYTTSQPGIYYIVISSGNASYTSTEPYRLTVYITDTSGPPGFSNPHLALGNPSNAAAVTDSTKNYLMEKSQYALSYNSSTGRPNWVSWQLNSSWLADVPRLDNFRVDDSLPSAWYHVNETDFSGSGYDRGHLCPSGDRTATETDNSETFLMTNMIPQAPDNNQGPWANLESYCRDRVHEGKELFIISGGYGSNGTIAAGHVSVPARTWKVIVVMNEPGISDITTATRVIGIDMPNVNGIRNDDWKNYRVAIDQIEAATGYDFLSNVSLSIQAAIESTVDNQ
ncbi:DNA/RNA non-specific endonuclease [bacterium]|nr:DNA/RNA non-specific endonuclease [bacterium]